jgi:hypothetical protein
MQVVLRLVREHGGLVIADEVQTGLGRTGEHMWAFSQYEVSLFALFIRCIRITRVVADPDPLLFLITDPDPRSYYLIYQKVKDFSQEKNFIIFDDLLGTYLIKMFR